METPGIGVGDLPEGLQAGLRQTARTQNRAVGEVLSEAVDRYLKELQWQSLRAYGRERAAERGIAEQDVPELIAQSRLESSR